MKRLSAPGERMLAFALLLGLVAVASPRAHSQNFSVVHTFKGSDGANPLSGLAIDGANLFGTTSAGGEYGEGTVFAVKLDGRGFDDVGVLPEAGSSGVNGDRGMVAGRHASRRDVNGRRGSQQRAVRLLLQFAVSALDVAFG